MFAAFEDSESIGAQSLSLNFRCVKFGKAKANGIAIFSSYLCCIITMVTISYNGWHFAVYPNGDILVQYTTQECLEPIYHPDVYESLHKAGHIQPHIITKKGITKVSSTTPVGTTAVNNETVNSTSTIETTATPNKGYRSTMVNKCTKSTSAIQVLLILHSIFNFLSTALVTASLCQKSKREALVLAAILTLMGSVICASLALHMFDGRVSGLIATRMAATPAPPTVSHVTPHDRSTSERVTSTPDVLTTALPPTTKSTTTKSSTTKTTTVEPPTKKPNAMTTALVGEAGTASPNSNSTEEPKGDEHDTNLYQPNIMHHHNLGYFLFAANIYLALVLISFLCAVAYHIHFKYLLHQPVIEEAGRPDY